jgi:hypothetical protein
MKTDSSMDGCTFRHKDREVTKRGGYHLKNSYLGLPVGKYNKIDADYL